MMREEKQKLDQVFSKNGAGKVLLSFKDKKDFNELVYSLTKIKEVI